MLYELFELDVKTIIAVLFWGNLTAVIPIVAYRAAGKDSSDALLTRSYVSARLCQAGAWFLLFFRNTLPDLISVNLGNTLLFVGFGLEATALILIIDATARREITLVWRLLIFCVFVFNLTEITLHTPSARVFVASLCGFAILIIPALQLTAFKKNDHFKRTMGIFYVFFLLLLLPRAYYALIDDNISIFTNFTVQVLTFVALIFLLTFSLSAYLIFMKQGTDKAISRMASTDFLTGLPNRQSFLEAAERAFGQHQERGDPVTVLFMDIDHFKMINDGRGHSFGDKVLKKFGEIVRNCLRTDDISCRYGGEEFVVLLSRTDGTISEKVTRRIMNEVARTAFSEDPAFRFTISVGVANAVPGDGDTLDQFIDNADHAMYRAKEAGRNRVMIFEAPPNTTPAV